MRIYKGNVYFYNGLFIFFVLLKLLFIGLTGTLFNQNWTIDQYRLKVKLGVVNYCKCNVFSLCVDVRPDIFITFTKYHAKKSSHVSSVSRWMTLQKIGASFIHSFLKRFSFIQWKKDSSFPFYNFCNGDDGIEKNNGHTILLNLTKIPSFTLKEGGRHFNFIARELWL